jgi:hypothetical protein
MNSQFTLVEGKLSTILYLFISADNFYMPDISQSSQATIYKALTQLSQLAPLSEVARQGVDVLVKHLTGNVISLNKDSALLNKIVLLNNPQIKGKLADGQTHQVKLSIENSPSLDFFSPISTKSTNVMSISEQQFQNLLRLPAKQLIPSSLDAINKLPVINATVLSVLPKWQLSTQLSTQLSPAVINQQVTTISTDEKNKSLGNQQNILRVLLTDLRPPVEMGLSVKQLSQFIVGEKVSLALAPKGNNWQLTISPNKTDTPNKMASQLLPDILQIAQTTPTSPTRVTSTFETKDAKNQQSILSPLLATPLIKASLLETNASKSANIELKIKPVLQQLGKVSNEQNQALIQKLHALPIDKIFLQLKPSGEINLLIQSINPVAKIPLTKEIAQALAPLKLPKQQTLIKHLDLPTNANKLTQAVNSDLNQNIQRPNTDLIHNKTSENKTTENKTPSIVPPVDVKKTSDIKFNLQEAGSNLLAAVREKPLAHSVISPSLLTNKPEQMNLVQSLLRIVKAKAEAPSVTLQSIEKALVDVEFFKGATEQSSKQIVEQILQQIKQSLPQGTDQDVNKIRQLLATPTLNLSTLQMISPTSSQGFMSGLVTLLQMSLSARLTRNQSSRAEHITTTINNVLSGTNKVKQALTSKAMSEMSQLEQKHQLIKEIGRLMSDHQTSKLSNAEQMIQGQETFYYNLPSALGGTIKDIELLIKREDNDKESASDDKQSHKTWQLTMKLAVGELGELLTKAKLRSDTLEINFYASNETVKIQVMNYLPLLRRKLDSLGIDVSKSHCQLGKIPDTLQQRPYHMFQAKA